MSTPTQPLCTPQPCPSSPAHPILSLQLSSGQSSTLPLTGWYSTDSSGHPLPPVWKASLLPAMAECPRRVHRSVLSLQSCVEHAGNPCAPGPYLPPALGLAAAILVSFWSSTLVLLLFLLSSQWVSPIQYPTTPCPLGHITPGVHLPVRRTPIRHFSTPRSQPRAGLGPPLHLHSQRLPLTTRSPHRMPWECSLNPHS